MNASGVDTGMQVVRSFVLHYVQHKLPKFKIQKSKYKIKVSLRDNFKFLIVILRFAFYILNLSE